MAELQCATPSSVDLSGLPPHVAETVSDLVSRYREELERRMPPDDFNRSEEWVRGSVFRLGQSLLRGIIEAQDDGKKRIEIGRRIFYRAIETPKTIITSIGPVKYWRPRYRARWNGSSLVPVDGALGLVNQYLTQSAAELALMMLGHCTARDAVAFFEKTGGMVPSASTLQHLGATMFERWESLGSTALDTIRKSEDIPQEAVTALVSLEGVKLPMNGKDPTRSVSCGTVSLFDDSGERLRTLYFAQMPQLGLKALEGELTLEVAHLREQRPDILISAVADDAPEHWGFLSTLLPETEVIDYRNACQHLQAVSKHSASGRWYDQWRRILRDDPNGVEKVIRSIRYLRDTAKSGKHKIERELDYFRKHRRRMRYSELEDRGIPIGSGVVEAANYALVAPRMQRQGMRWSVEGAQSVLTFRALIKSDRFDAAWRLMIGGGQPEDDVA